MGIYASERAGDVGGALSEMDADVDGTPTSGPRGRVVHAVWVTTSVIASLPLASAKTTSEPKGEAVNRRHRPSLVLKGRRR
jgi:hypothetical protein